MFIYISIKYNYLLGLDPTLCDPVTRLLCPWNFPGKSTGVGCHFLLQGIFLTQGSNLGLPYCRQTFYHLSQEAQDFLNQHN